MAESFFNEPDTQESPPNEDNKDICHYSNENEDPDQDYEGKQIFHSPAAMVIDLRESFKSGLLNGRLLAQTILFIFKSHTTSDKEIEDVFEIANTLDDASATSAKVEFIEQIMFIAQYCYEHESRSYIIPQKLLPLVVKFLKESTADVRKTSHATLLVLLEQGLVDRRDVEEQVCPVILELTKGQDSPHDYRTEAAALLSKLAPLVGKEVSERIFLERFAELCSDKIPFVRQVCADNFGDFSSVVGPEATEKILLPKFFKLCKDSMWKIRKSCADEFMPVSCLYGSQWAMLQNFNGEMVIADVEVLAIRLEVLEQKRSMQGPSLDSDEECDLDGLLDLLLIDDGAVIGGSQLNDVNKNDTGDHNNFNSFLYWKTPLPSLDESELPTNVRDFFNDDNRDIGNELRSLMEDEEEGLNKNDQNKNCSSIENKKLIQHLEQHKKHDEDESKKSCQNIVPQSLVDHFVGMIGPKQAGDIDTETVHHCCAFSFPAVALTLGRSNWYLLKKAYGFLANDVQWKVRYTMAASIYELGIILGEEMTGSDLVPFFFAVSSRISMKRDFLPLFSIFLSSYNVLNWRFREELAIQIDSMVDIYEAEDVKNTLAPIALILVRDKVAAVRKASLNVLCRIIKCFTDSPSDDALCRSLLGDLSENLASNQSPWVTRQTYAALSYQILSTRSLHVSHFALYVLPHLLNLSNDRVPNVRIAVARVLVDHICNIDYFNNKANPCHLSVVKTLAVLESDTDTDVINYLANASISSKSPNFEDHNVDVLRTK
ncbi:PPP4R1 [Lepeophtheirus salmonis]|uniref:PPP4R1 n=1 Tax=Lepeophtheirus salmonis TaxID=72036 RepID=A0A7R8H867_LEPSM|nr:PPP4R1 [Lepeophtheirus salmonis]CAF2934733.1 PPP4R1 [Lepeophtheirus salmonis]